MRPHILQRPKLESHSNALDDGETAKSDKVVTCPVEVRAAWTKLSTTGGEWIPHTEI